MNSEQVATALIDAAIELEALAGEDSITDRDAEELAKAHTHLMNVASLQVWDFPELVNQRRRALDELADQMSRARVELDDFLKVVKR